MNHYGFDDIPKIDGVMYPISAVPACDMTVPHTRNPSVSDVLPFMDVLDLLMDWDIEGSALPTGGTLRADASSTLQMPTTR